MEFTETFFFRHFPFISRRNVPDRFVWRMDSNHVSASLDQTNRKPNHANYVVKFLAKIIHAKVHSNGTKRLMMFPTCSLNPERLATTTSDTVTCFRNVVKLIHPDRWRRFENSSCPKKASHRSRSGLLAIGMQLVLSS